MFDSLSDRLQGVFRSLRGEVRLTEQTVEAALREIRMALLEADVNFKVVKAFIDRVRDKAVDQEVLKSLTPAQQVVRIVRDEMLALFGDSAGGLAAVDRRGRASSCCSGFRVRARRRRRESSGGGWRNRGSARSWCRPTCAGRPPSSSWPSSRSRPACAFTIRRASWIRCAARRARSPKRRTRLDVVIVDTAGRLHIDDELMVELQAIKDATQPTDLLYVADAMTGQDAIKSAGEFNRRMGVTGVVLTKMDGDARGGAALSVVGVVGVPIAFAGSGERLQDLEPFHPDRVVSRVLGMGDVLSLIEKAEEAVSVEDAEELEQKIRKNEFDSRGLPRSAADDQEDGPARADSRHAAGHGRPEAGDGRTRRPRRRPALAHRGDDQLDDVEGTARTIRSSTAAAASASPRAAARRWKR